MTRGLFWLSAATLTYTFVGYPALAWWLARVRPRPVHREPIEPPVSILIAAHNEADRIGARIENCRALDYRPDRLEIVIASDGSTDATADVARRYERPASPGPAVRVIAYPWRRGKPSVLNDAIPACRGAIVVLGDARQRYEADAVRLLVENFADHSVGAASGELVLRNETGAPVGDGVGAYWRYEKLIRRAESACYSTVGATGAIYALRRRLFEPIPPDSLDDDVVLPVRIARRGYRVVFDARARAWDRAAATGYEEYTRKVRTIAGIVQLFARERWLLSPTHRLWLPAVSHKLLRLAAPFLMLGTLLTAAVLAERRTLYLALFTAQLAFYAAALGGVLLRRRRSRLARWLGIPYAFCLLNSTTLVALCRSVTGRQSVQWTKATETAEAKPA